MIGAILSTRYSGAAGGRGRGCAADRRKVSTAYSGHHPEPGGLLVPMKVENVYLAGIGSYLPELVSTEHAVKAGWLDEEVRQYSGIESVAVENTVSAPDMAIRAAEIAIRRSGHATGEFAALLHSNTYHQGPDGWSPAHYVLRHTLNTTIPAMEIRQGCLGMVASLEMAACRLAASSGPDAVLLTTGDNFSTPLVDRWRASGLFLFADAGAAVVVSRRGGFARLVAVGSLSDPSMEALHRGDETLLPPGVTAGRPLDFEARLNYWRRQWASGVKPPIGHFGDRIAEIAKRTLLEAGISMREITRVSHVGFNHDPLHAMFLEPLGITAERGSWEQSKRIGHTGVADLVLGLEYLWTTRQVKAGDHVMLVGAATGMEAGCAIVEIVAEPETA